MEYIRIAIAALLGALSVSAFAQNITAGNSYEVGHYTATAFAYGENGTSLPLVVDSPASTTAGASATLTVAYGNSTTPDGITFAPLSILAPITIVNANGAETVTPTAVSCSTPAILDTCTVTATFTFAHGKGDRIVSGTFGLQEAIDVAHIASAGTGGTVVVDALWANQGGTTTMLTAALPFHNVQIEDTRAGGVQYWNPTQSNATVLAVPTTLVAAASCGGSTTFCSDATATGTWTSGSIFGCVAYVDAAGQEGPCSATANFTAVASKAVDITAPAASTGAVGYTMYISLPGGSYVLAYKVPITSSVCTLSKIETAIAACAVANSTYGQAGANAQVAAITVNTARTIVLKTGVDVASTNFSSMANGRTGYSYAPSMHVGLPGVVSTSLPFTGATAPATTVPATLGTVNIPAGFMNYVGRTIRVCGFVTEASTGSTSTITSINFYWNADGSNTATGPVSLGGPTVTATLVTANADQWQFCQNFTTTVSGAGVTAGSILATAGWLTESYGSATTVASATGPTIGAAAVGSLNLAGEARLDVVYTHTTGTDGATPILQNLTVEVLN